METINRVQQSNAEPCYRCGSQVALLIYVYRYIGDGTFGQQVIANLRMEINRHGCLQLLYLTLHKATYVLTAINIIVGCLLVQ